ncbi:MAG: hypothetical protein R3195_16985 [Gemmatimonadota bacterium]|nr:hypothetical protein [Gemmatimonadota bacterium]
MADSKRGMSATEKKRLGRASLAGFLLGGSVFALLGVYMNWQIGDPAFSNPGPTLVLATIGGTVAGLVGPMFRRRRRR